jgi:hypothetical protein
MPWIEPEREPQRNHAPSAAPAPAAANCASIRAFYATARRRADAPDRAPQLSG